MANLKDVTNNDRDRANRDAITGTPGSHPVGTGVGAAAAGAAGAAIGAMGGPVGIVVGAVVGAVAGGLAGKEVGEEIRPTEEDNYWRNNYRTRPYVRAGTTYDTYRPAYEHGWESYTRYQGQSFDDIEANLRQDWERRNPSLQWDQAKDAVRDSFSRLGQRGTARGEGATVKNVENASTATGRPVDRRDVEQRREDDVRRDEVRRANTNVP